MKKILGVEFFRMDVEGEDYAAYDIKRCHDETDRMLYVIVMRDKECITMGCVTARPIWK